MLFLLFCSQSMRHKSCTQFSFFQIIRQNMVNDGFRYPILSAIILQLAWGSSFKAAATQAMLTFVFAVPGLPLCSASSIDSSPTANRLCSASSIHSSPTTNRLCHRNTVARDTCESLNAFTNISHVFADVNSALQQNFIAARYSTFFSVVIYETSTNIRYCKMHLCCRI